MIEVFGDRLIVEPIVEEQTVGGIFIPEDEQKKRTQRAKVVAVGSDFSYPVIVGDTVIYHDYGLMEVKDGDKSISVIQSEDVIGRVSNGE
jgi:co-chaperonin GroES (HSP10)